MAERFDYRDCEWAHRIIMKGNPQPGSTAMKAAEILKWAAYEIVRLEHALSDCMERERRANRSKA